jgi:hypothetical protein
MGEALWLHSGGAWRGGIYITPPLVLVGCEVGVRGDDARALDRGYRGQMAMACAVLGRQMVRERVSE